MLTAIQDIDKQSHRTLVVEKISIFKAKRKMLLYKEMVLKHRISYDTKKLKN